MLPTKPSTLNLTKPEPKVYVNPVKWYQKGNQSRILCFIPMAILSQSQTGALTCSLSISTISSGFALGELCRKWTKLMVVAIWPEVLFGPKEYNWFGFALPYQPRYIRRKSKILKYVNGTTNINAKQSEWDQKESPLAVNVGSVTDLITFPRSRTRLPWLVTQLEYLESQPLSVAFLINGCYW